MAIKLRHWETVREDRAEILEQIAKRLAHKTSSHYGYDGLLYSKVSNRAKSLDIPRGTNP